LGSLLIWWRYPVRTKRFSFCPKFAKRTAFGSPIVQVGVPRGVPGASDASRCALSRLLLRCCSLSRAVDVKVMAMSSGDATVTVLVLLGRLGRECEWMGQPGDSRGQVCGISRMTYTR